MATVNQRTIITAGVVLGVALLGFAATAGASPPKGCKPAPFVFPTIEQVAPLVSEALAKGERSNVRVAVYVASRLVPTRPGTSAKQAYPPPINDTAATCFFDSVLALVAQALEGLGIPPYPACDPGATLDASAGRCVPGIDVRPYEDPDGNPRHGQLFQVKFKDIFLGTYVPEEQGDTRSLVYAVLYDAAFEAATQIGGMPTVDAEDFATKFASTPAHRMDYYNLILCSPWNDALYGTYGYGAQAVPGDHGRAIRFLPRHNDIRKALITGESLKRNISIGDPQNPGNGQSPKLDPSGNSLEYLWFPRISLTALWNSGIVTTAQPDAAPGIMPPPEIAAMIPAPGGIVNQWGC